MIDAVRTHLHRPLRCPGPASTTLSRRDSASWTLGQWLAVAILAGCGGSYLAPGARVWGEEPAVGAKDSPPFARRVDVPEFSADLEWVNTKEPIRLESLRGKFVLLDFWTYCCINCMHVLPELKKLEQAYPRELVVLGIHSAKFSAEGEAQNVRDAARRYDIAHPVANDHGHTIWKTFGVRSWPTLLLIDPEGKAVVGRAGESTFEMWDEVLKQAIPYYRAQGLLKEEPLDLLANDTAEPTPLRFPGKIVAHAPSQRLFISDSNHHRIVVTDLSGKLLQVIGSGAQGRTDGALADASFHHPQGLALDAANPQPQQLYVADTENHLIRKVDLALGTVATVAGTGVQDREGWPHDPQFDALPVRQQTPWLAKPGTTAINSPWDLWIQDGYLWIAMAGPHQIWRMDLAETQLGPYAGNGREDIVDGARLPSEPLALGACSFAQPSGLVADEKWLYVADSEGSSIRAVPFDPAERVRTVVGTADRPDFERLFTFGDQDGPRDTAQLQHALGLTRHGRTLYVADTYNSKIKAIDADTGTVTTLALKQAAGDDAGPQGESAWFDEPAGISYADGKLYVADTNRHRIQVIDLETHQVSTLTISGLAP